MRALGSKIPYLIKIFISFEVSKHDITLLMREYDKDETGRVEYHDFVDISKNL